MIVVDTSAFAAILFGEEDADVYIKAMADAKELIVPAPIALELRTVLHRRLGPDHVKNADGMLSADIVSIVAWDESHLPMAMDALRRFGGRPARLNFGDCMVYAVARSLDMPLLYKGNDFAQTDIRSAL